MNNVHRNILQTSCTYLIDNITSVEGICDYLMTDGILDPGLKDTILTKTPKPKGQIRELIYNQLPKRGPTAFDCFIDALNNTNQEYIAKHLNNQLPQNSIT